jgi:uncharacterized protein
MLHTDTELRFISPAIGLGVVATRPIPRGTIVWTACALDRVFERASMTAFAPEVQAQIVKWSLVDAAGDYLVCWDDGRYVNHSCEPSMLPLGRDVEIVVRDLQPGDHVTAEYGRQNVAPLACSCGAKSCRGVVRAEDALRHGAAWDRLLGEALPLVDKVAQPLLPYVRRPDELWAWVHGEIAPPSLCDSYYRVSAPAAELALTLPPRVTPRPVQPARSELGALMALFEELSRHCFARGLGYVVLAGCDEEGALRPPVVEIAMSPDDHRRLCATLRPTATMRLVPCAGGGPARRVAVVPGADSRFHVRVDVVVQRGDVHVATMPLYSGRERVVASPGPSSERARGPATAAVRDFGSVAEALRETGGRAPFRVLDCRDFDVDARGFDELLSREREPLLAWSWSRDTEAEMVKRYVAPAAAAQGLRDGSLDVTIVDAPVRAPGLALPEALRPWPLGEEGRQFELCYVLTAPGWVTPFHADPAYGGGWVHLIGGEKLWWMVDPAAAPLDALVDRHVAQALEQDDFHLWGKIHMAHQPPGSLVYFPPSWAHRVLTYERAFGFGGYLATPPVP